MSDLYLVAASEDRRRARSLARALRRSGLTVETGGRGGPGEEELARAGCIVVLWSDDSVPPAAEDVHRAAAEALKRGVLLSVLLDRVSPPPGFDHGGAIDLVGWQGDRDDRRFVELVGAARRLLSAPPAGGGRRLHRLRTAAVTAGTVLTFALGFFANLAGVQDTLCRAPGVRELCRAAGLGGVPSRQEEALWRKVWPAGGCAGLHEYLARYPVGAYAAEAERRLGAAVSERRESWSPDERPLPLRILPGRSPSVDETAAREDARRRGTEQARRLCSGFDGGEFRLRSVGVEVEPDGWDCSPRDGGTVCGFDGLAVCAIEVRRVSVAEVCRPDSG